MPGSLLVRLILWAWFGSAVAFGYFQLLQRLAPPALPLIVFGLTGCVLYAYFRLAALRAWVDSLDSRRLVLLHLTRFVGIYFLILHRRGELPAAFALPAGIGDIIVATMALPVVFAPVAESTRQRAIVIWNVAGFADIMLVVATAARLNLADPAQMHAFTHLPLSLLPTFLVPLIIATHVLLFVRTMRRTRPD
jgi:hypothetical protein